MADRPQPRLRQGEFATAAWALALLVSMFALKWYGVDNIPGRGGTVVVAVDAWNGLGILRWLMLATIALAIASVALHLTQRDHGTQSDTSLPLAIAATFVAVGLVYRVLIVLPSPNSVVDQKLGALIGLGCSVAMALSAWRARRAALAAAKAPPARRHRRAAPAVPGVERPASSGVERPGAPGVERPALSGVERPEGSGVERPAVSGVERPEGSGAAPAVVSATSAAPPGGAAAPHTTRVRPPAARSAPPTARVPSVEAAPTRTPRPASP